MKKRTIRAFLANIIVVIFMCVSTFVMFNILINSTKEFQTANISILKDAKLDSIIEAIDEISNQAYEYLIPLSKDIEKEIRANCDMEQLEQDLSAGVINEDFQRTLKSFSYKRYFSNIENDKNDIFIANRNKILVDFSHDTTYEKQTRTWEDEIKTFANPDSAATALKKLYIQDDSIIAWEREASANKDHIYYKNINKENIRKIYKEEGWEGLKNYQVLVPIYITTDGDIFGKPDIKNGIYTNNNKIIIIQEFNIYEQLMKYFPAMINEQDIKMVQKDYDHMMMHLHTFGVVVIVSIIGVVVSTCLRFNSALEQEEENDNKESDDVES